jgi:hypothetical protein
MEMLGKVLRAVQVRAVCRRREARKDQVLPHLVAKFSHD